MQSPLSVKSLMVISQKWTLYLLFVLFGKQNWKPLCICICVITEWSVVYNYLNMLWFWCVSSTKLGNLSSYFFFLLFWLLWSFLLLLSIPATFWKPPRPAKNTPDTKNEQEGIHGDTPHTCIQHTGGDLWRRESHGAVHSFTHWDQNHSTCVAHIISTQSAHALMWGSHDQHMISCEGHMIGTQSHVRVTWSAQSRVGHMISVVSDHVGGHVISCER